MVLIQHSYISLWYSGIYVFLTWLPHMAFIRVCVYIFGGRATRSIAGAARTTVRRAIIASP